MDCKGLEWIARDWNGLAWLGLAWPGLAWLGWLFCGGGGDRPCVPGSSVSVIGNMHFLLVFSRQAYTSRPAKERERERER